jgi:hypothetical protein
MTRGIDSTAGERADARYEYKFLEASSIQDEG